MVGRLLTRWTLPVLASLGVVGAAFGVTAAAAAAPGPVVFARVLTLGGHKINALVNARGFTLYYDANDTSTKVTCLGACAKRWPPLLAASQRVSAGKGVTGKLTVLKDALGLQVLYNGHPLYTYSGDKKPGQAAGQGLGKVWWVATVNVKAAGAKA